MVGLGALGSVLGAVFGGASLLNAKSQDKKAYSNYEKDLRLSAKLEAERRESRLKNRWLEKFNRFQAKMPQEDELDEYKKHLLDQVLLNPPLMFALMGTLANKVRRKKRRKSAPYVMANEEIEGNFFQDVARHSLMGGITGQPNPQILQLLMQQNMMSQPTSVPHEPMSQFSSMAPALAFRLLASNNHVGNWLNSGMDSLASKFGNLVGL